MLLLIFFVLLAIIGFLLYYFDDKYWDTAGIAIVGCTSAILGCIGTFFAVGALIVALCSAPTNQAAWELKYDKLSNKVAHIDSYNREEIVAEVDEWNAKWRENTYAPKSPWIGWYHTIDTSTTDLIKIN